MHYQSNYRSNPKKRYSAQAPSYEVVDHPFEPYIPSDCHTLVLGTFPTYEGNRRFDYFYGGEGNQFWPFLEYASGHRFYNFSDPEAESERKAFLDAKGIGLADMITKAYRENRGSQDTKIHPIKLLDLFGILEQYPVLNKLVLTSRTRINGTLGLLETYLLRNDHKFDFPDLSKKGIIRTSLTFSDRTISIIIPYSPSQSYLQQDTQKIAEAREMYAQVFRR